MRPFCAIAPLLVLLACKKVVPPAERTDVHERECSELVKRVEAINRTSVEVGVATKEDGGSLAEMWEGFSRLANADAHTPKRSTDVRVLRWEQGLIDLRARSVPAFATLAMATERGTAREQSSAGDEVAKLGAEWKELERNLRAGCP